jgi:hypothetical protein
VIGSGQLLCCFEAARHSKGNGALTLRVLKIMEPMTCLDPSYKGPLHDITEGDLVRTPNGEVWILGQTEYCLPKAAARALLSTRVEDIG